MNGYAEAALNLYHYLKGARMPTAVDPKYAELAETFRTCGAEAMTRDDLVKLLEHAEAAMNYQLVRQVRSSLPIEPANEREREAYRRAVQLDTGEIQ